MKSYEELMNLDERYFVSPTPVLCFGGVECSAVRYIFFSQVI